MADKSFGVKELNLLNASGTPTVTSPNNLNLNANTVAISTSATVGNNLTVSGQINVGSNIKIGNAGVVTATSFVGSGANLTGISAGISTDPSNVQATWKLGGGSGSGFTFTGPGQDGSEGNPDIYLVRGQRYLFDNTALAGSHPFEFRNEANSADYTDGVSGAQNGLQYINVQHDAPAALKYRCTIHTGSMVGNIYIVGQHLANGANNRVLTATSAYGINAESNMTFDGDDLTISHTGLAVNIFESTDNHSRLRIKSADASLAQLEFGDQSDADAGEIRYDHGNDRMTIHVGNNVERLRINSSGTITTPHQFHIEVQRSGDQTGYDGRSSAGGTPVVFNDVVRTRGTANSALNTSTGKITVPVDGVYFLEASAYTTSGNALSQGWFTEGSSRMTYSDITQHTSTDQIQAHGMHYLSANTEVGFHPYGATASSITIAANIYHTWFRVTLIG